MYFLICRFGFSKSFLVCSFGGLFLSSFTLFIYLYTYNSFLPRKLTGLVKLMVILIFFFFSKLLKKFIDFENYEKFETNYE